MESYLTGVTLKYGLGTVRLYPENKIIRFNALRYWRRHHKRWPAWFEAFNRFVNRIMTALFVKFFK